MTHRITLEGANLRFAAAHMATFGGECEPLHGHNYAVRAEITGALTPDSWVFDFSEARRLIAALCKELDHKFILQVNTRFLAIARAGSEYEVSFGDRRYVMPAADVAALPIDNSTAERLAEWFAGRIMSELAARGTTNVESVTVGVEEAPGQAGWFTLRLRDAEGGRRDRLTGEGKNI